MRSCTEASNPPSARLRRTSSTSARVQLASSPASARRANLREPLTGLGELVILLELLDLLPVGRAPLALLPPPRGQPRPARARHLPWVLALRRGRLGGRPGSAGRSQAKDEEDARHP